MPFNPNAPTVTPLLQLTVTFLLSSKISRVPSSAYNLFEFFKNLVMALKRRAGSFGHGICVLDEEEVEWE